MRKTSRQIFASSENRRRWDCGVEGFAEWTFEGGLERGQFVMDWRQVEADGDHCRYHVTYMPVYDKGGFRQFEWYRG